MAFEVDRVDGAGRRDLADERGRPRRLRVELEANTGRAREPAPPGLDRGPKPSSFARNCCRTISTPCSSGSPIVALAELRAASIARSRLSTTSSRLTSTSRRLRSASFASSLRMRARASSNSCAAWRYLPRYSCACFSSRRACARALRRRYGFSDVVRGGAFACVLAARPPAAIDDLTGISCSSAIAVTCSWLIQDTAIHSVDANANVSCSPSRPIVTVPPFSSAPNRISSVSRSRTSVWITRASGRAPNTGS